MKRYSVSKNFKWTLTAALVGCILLFPALISMIRFHLATDLSAASLKHLSSGTYLRCQIDQYYVLPLTINGEQTSIYAGRLGSLSTNGNPRQYVIYYANVEDEAYVRIGIQDPDLLSRLDAFEMGHGEPIQFFGRLTWHREYDYSIASQTKWEGFDADRYLQDYCILQLDEQKEYKSILRRILWGAFFWILSILFLALGFGISPLLARPLEETTEYVRLAKVDHYALAEELEQKKRKLEILQWRLQGLRKWALLGIFFVLFGIALLINARLLWTIPHSFSLPGSLLILLGLEMIWHAFIQSDADSALRIADRFTLETLAVKVKREEILIGVISKRMDEEKRQKAVRAREDANQKPPTTPKS